MLKVPRRTTSVKLAAHGSARGATDPARQLKFGAGNAKLSPLIVTFSLAAGHSCPYALKCRSSANPKTGTITDGKDVEFRCYAATMEARRPSVRRARWHNFEQLRACKSVEEMSQLILDSLSPFARLVRVHDSGDFFSQDYFDAWLLVAKSRPNTTLYAYTKAIPFWVRRLDFVGDGYDPGAVPNFVLTASYGGTHDRLIREHKLRSARVVYSQAQAEELGLEIDHTDEHAMAHGADFCLLIHGMQPGGSEAGRAVQALRKSGWSGYGKSTRFPLTTL